MSEPSPHTLPNAVTQGLSEVTLERTLALWHRQLETDNDRLLNFRGDLAERYGYDKVKPLLAPARTQGHVVVIQGVSQKTGETAPYQILSNQWNLLEVLARLD